MSDRYDELYTKLYRYWKNIGKYILFVYAIGMILFTLLRWVSLFLSWIWLLISVVIVYMLYFIFKKNDPKHGYEGDV